MKFLPDQVVARLQTEMQTPDLSGTRYRPLKFLGQGGMGTVWLVEDAVLCRPVALKILTAENSSANLAARLMQEAVVLARLEHPGIVPVHDAGTLPDGRTFYCMKHVEGQTLDQHVDQLPLRQRLLLFQRIAEPLAFAHSRGIIHRDLKPANIMVGAFGEVLIMDWGLAKVTDATGASLRTGQVPGHVMGAPGQFSPAKQVSGHEFTRAVEGPLVSGALAPENALATTAHGTVLGTPGYMAPEQERGEVNLIDMPVSAYRENIFERIARLVSRNRVAVVLVLAYLFMRLLFILFSRH